MTRAVGDPTLRTRRWTRREYDRLIELGVLHEDEPIELLAGRLVVREPQRTAHATATQLAADALRAAFGVGWSVRVQLPIALDDESEPEPDVPSSGRRAGYANVRRLPAAETITPLAAPTSRISVADLLP